MAVGFRAQNVELRARLDVRFPRLSLTELSVASLDRPRHWGQRADPARLGVVAAAAGRLGRALALADVAPTGSPELADLLPSLFHEVGRSIDLRGRDRVFLIEVRGGRVRTFSPSPTGMLPEPLVGGVTAAT